MSTEPTVSTVRTEPILRPGASGPEQHDASPTTAALRERFRPLFATIAAGAARREARAALGRRGRVDRQLPHRRDRAVQRRQIGISLASRLLCRFA